MNNRKFKIPFAIPEWDVKKGDIFYLLGDKEYFTNKNVFLPASIVEQWEEVFDERPKTTFDDIVVGKTVLINRKSGIEWLVIAKNTKLATFLIENQWTSLDTANLFYTIKQ